MFIALNDQGHVGGVLQDHEADGAELAPGWKLRWYPRGTVVETVDADPPFDQVAPPIRQPWTFRQLNKRRALRRQRERMDRIREDDFRVREGINRLIDDGQRAAIRQQVIDDQAEIDNPDETGETGT
jgi:hypothetical protein